MLNHLDYEKSECSDNNDYRNGCKAKRINISYESMDIQVLHDWKSTFEPQVAKKHQKDISDISALIYIMKFLDIDIMCILVNR